MARSSHKTLETGCASDPEGRPAVAQPWTMVVGVTSPQTCLVLSGRLRALRLAGFAVTLVAGPGALLTQRGAVEGVAVCPIPMERRIAPLADCVSLIRLLTMLGRVRPVLTDFSTPKAGLLGNLAAWVLRVPHRVYTLRGLKLESSRGIKRALLLAVERLTARCAHVVLCNSASLRAAALELHLAPADKLHLLGDGSSNGVDIERYHPASAEEVRVLRAAHGFTEDEPVLGFVGRLTDDKGVPELLEAFEGILCKEPRCWLLVVGWFDAAEDALAPYWRRRIEEHPRIRHIDFAEDTVPFYQAMDVLILPTHREGFPNVALEAAACGLPVITTESTGARDAVLAEVTGLLIPSGVPQAIEDAALRLVRERGTRHRMGEAARAWVVERFSHERVLRLATEFYKSLVDGSTTGSITHPTQTISTAERSSG